MGEKEKHSLCVSSFLKNQKHLPLSWAACWLRAVVGGLGMLSSVSQPSELSSTPMVAADIFAGGRELSTQTEGEAAETNLFPLAAFPNPAQNSGTYWQRGMWLENLQCRGLDFGLSQKSGHVPLNSGSCISFAVCYCRDHWCGGDGEVWLVLWKTRKWKRVQRTYPSLTNVSLPNQLHSLFFLHFSQRGTWPRRFFFLFPFPHCISALWAHYIEGPLLNP